MKLTLNFQALRLGFLLDSLTAATKLNFQTCISTMGISQDAHFLVNRQRDRLPQQLQMNRLKIKAAGKVIDRVREIYKNIPQLKKQKTGSSQHVTCSLGKAKILTGYTQNSLWTLLSVSRIKARCVRCYVCTAVCCQSCLLLQLHWTEKTNRLLQNKPQEFKE